MKEGRQYTYMDIFDTILFVLLPLLGLLFNALDTNKDYKIRLINITCLLAVLVGRWLADKIH